MLFWLTSVFTTLSYIAFASINYEPSISAEWVTLNYTWDSDHLYNVYVSNGDFIVDNCLLAGIKVDHNGVKYVTVPRWRSGVPATLNTLVYSSVVDNYLLKPYPNWDIQTVGVDGDLQNCQSMVIDDSNIMWVIEVGRRNFYDGNPADVVNNPAGVWRINLNTNEILSKYYFSNDVVQYNSSFVDDIVLNQDTQIAFLTDAWDMGAIIVYDYLQQKSRRYYGISTKNDPNYVMIINLNVYGKRIFTTPVDGIVITDDYQAILYCAVQGTTLYRLSTDVLSNFDLSNSDIDSYVENLGQKEPSDGMMYRNGVLYYGSLPTSTYFYVKVDATSQINCTSDCIQACDLDPQNMHWIDTFSNDPSNGNNLWFISNKLDFYILQTMDFTGESGANMRLMRVDISKNDKEKSHKSIIIGVVIASVFAIVFLCGLWLYYHYLDFGVHSSTSNPNTMSVPEVNENNIDNPLRQNLLNINNE